MSLDGPQAKEFEEFSTTEEARKQIWNIKNIAVTAFLLALAVSLIAAGVPALLQTYFGSIINFSVQGISVLLYVSWITVILGILILVLASWFILEQYRPQTTKTKRIHAPLFYLVGEGTAFPMSTQYYPQQMAKIAFPVLVSRYPERKEQMQDINPTFVGERSAFAEFYEFLFIFWLHTNQAIFDYRDGLSDLRRIETAELDVRLRENTFIDFFTDFEGDDPSTRQFSQLRPELPEDVNLVYRGPDELNHPGTNTNSFAIQLDGNWCSLEILVTCNPGHSLSSYGSNEYAGMPLEPIDARKFQHYMTNDQGPVAQVYTRVDVTVDYTFRHLLFGRFRSYDPNAYISWLEDTAQHLTGGHPMGGWSWAATAERIRTDHLEDIHRAVKSLQRSLDEVPDPDTIDDDFFERHLEAVEERW